ncbi:conserved hypothetical protein [Desulforapulum autotrophicum HRM2]|uniref:DUF374 domain-containing protein n=1 Tax=Desulforapulum autotrophicum (strain ATCC 43914 / DSM 3382 / VKM B-1955 / HRM2) TaxID=177437 RepID=C0QBX9_DESAH|nr:lysophospholipid acyltransferase family protein [Desulforapulum autotrophicum]ACN14991.1 conserved hypothetical protein [Desulforapulum autotrophicum HRM2]
MKKTMKRGVRSKGVVWLLYRLVRAYTCLLRIRVVNESLWQRHIDQGGSVVLCVFHQHFFSLIRHFKRYKRFNPCIMISQSRDGDIIAPVAQLTGWTVARGSSSRGGKDAMEDMIQRLEMGCLGANLVDGPTGPMGKVKPGVVRMAQRSGAWLVPCVVIPESAWFFHSWDRFFIPKPLSRVTIKYLPMETIDGRATRDGFEQTRKHVETAMAPYLLR